VGTAIGLTWGGSACSCPPEVPASSALGLVAALEIERHGGADETLQGRLIDLVVFVDVDGAPDIALEAGVEQASWVWQRRSLGKGHLDDVLVRLFEA
jgi:hypothetical protein